MTDTTPPIWGAPEPTPIETPRRKQTQREIDREETFRRNASKPLNYRQNIRTANGAAGRYDYVNIEALYKGFRDRMATDEIFQHTIVERVMDRIMAELYVPLSHTPRRGTVLKLCRKE